MDTDTTDCESPRRVSRRAWPSERHTEPMLLRDIARATLASLVHLLKTVKVGHRVADSRIAAWICGEGAVVARLRGGSQAIVLANDYNGRCLYLWGDSDPRITAVVDAVLRAGDTALDIGANLGVVGLFAAHRVGSTGTVHFFEPQPLAASCLRTSLLVNRYSSAHLHECALSDSSGFATMTILDPGNYGMTTLAAPTEEPAAPLRTIRVRTEPAGEFIASLGCAKVTMIKIDVEGHEPIILASMRKWLAEAHPAVILFECYLNNLAFQEHDSVRILSEIGYEFYGFDMKPLWKTRLIAVNERQHPAGRDFVAVLWHELDEDRRNAIQAMVN